MESVARGCNGFHLIHNIRTGGSSSTSSAHLGRSYMPTLLLLLSKLSLELGSTRAGLWLRPKGTYASRVALCAVETESRKSSQLLQTEVVNVASSRPVSQLLHCSYKEEVTINCCLEVINNKSSIGLAYFCLSVGCRKGL